MIVLKGGGIKTYRFGRPADFARSSSAYMEGGTQVQANEPRYEPGKFGQALMVEEGTTNIFQNPSFEVDLTGWYLNQGVATIPGSLSRTTQEKYYGEASAKLVKGDSQAYIQQQDINLLANTTYTITAKIKTDAPTIGIVRRGNVNSFNRTQFSVPENVWTTIKTTFNTENNTTYSIGFGWESKDVDAGKVVYIDGVQLEQKPYATSFIDGTRANEVVTVPTEGVLSAEEGTIDVWVWVDEIVRRQQSGRWNRIFNIQKSVGGAGIGLYHQPGSPNWTLEVRGDDDVYQGVSVNDSYTPNGWNMFTIKWSAQEAVLLINGVRRGVLNNPRLPSGLEDIAHIGSGGSTSHINTKFDSLRLSRIARTDEEISAYDLTKPLPVDEYTTAKMDFNKSLSIKKTGIKVATVFNI